MKHDTAIPLPLHTGFAADVRDALGAFWSSVFRDRELVDATVSARVLSACQAYIDVMEALSLRDHSGMPVFHREHWHPLLIRLSKRNTGCGLVLGMENAKLGPQPEASIYLEDSVFVIGGNAEFSKVNTYPLDPSARNLVSVGTCICDAIGAPLHVLFPGRDFMLRDGVLLVRKEQDPFAAGGYRIVEDGDDRIAVVWVCDAALDREHVGDFLAYPLGFDTPSTPVAARLLSALWDVVVYGLTPRHLNLLLGALFDVPTVPRDTAVESVTTEKGGFMKPTVFYACGRVIYGFFDPEDKARLLHKGSASDVTLAGITKLASYGASRYPCQGVGGIQCALQFSGKGLACEPGDLIVKD